MAESAVTSIAGKSVDDLDYYNRYDKSKNWERVRVRSGRAFQSAEVNEMQDMMFDRIKDLGDTLYPNGTVLGGCEISIDKTAEVVRLSEGTVWFKGGVRVVPAAELSVSMTGTVEIGVALTEIIQTELQNKELFNPAHPSADYGRPGAARLIWTFNWKVAEPTDLTSNTFVTVYTLKDGELPSVVAAAAENTSTIIADQIARYDRESHGSYVTEGMHVRVMEPTDEEREEMRGKQIYSISDGHAHVNGYEVTFRHSERLVVDEKAEFREALNESHIFTGADASGKAKIALYHTPVETVSKVSVLRESTDVFTHGSYHNCLDPFPNSRTGVIKIIEIKQGDTVFTQGTDFVLNGDSKIDWAPTGNEPTPGSTYQVKYQYRDIVSTPVFDTKGIEVWNAVEGSEVFADYEYRLERVDKIVLYKDGKLGVVRGISHLNSPVAPETPSDALCLAVVYQAWTGLPQVENNAIKAVSMTEMQALRDSLYTLYNAVATLSLSQDALATAPSSSSNIFADPFFDNDMRDAGIEQTAVIVNGMLMIPIAASEIQFDYGLPQVLDYDEVRLLGANKHTGSMKINPYDAFDPMPITMALEPSVDHWTKDKTVNLTANGGVISGGTVSGGTITVNQSSWVYTSAYTKGTTRTSTSTSTSTSSSISSSIKKVTTSARTTEDDKDLRVRDVALIAAGLGPNEKYSVTFDGIRVISDANADADGKVARSFTIPSGLSSGTKRVQLTGTASNGSASYTGTGTIVTTTNMTTSFTVQTTILTTTRTVKTTYYVGTASVDPLAQTFILDEGRFVSGVNLYFTKRGSSKVRVEIREVTAGVPNDVVLARAEMEPEAISVNRMNKFTFEYPVFLEPETYYAIVVLTDAADHEVAIGQLGQFDQNSGKWVTQQPLQAGVLHSSSNANSWTAHQDSDLYFDLLGTSFKANKKTLVLGTVGLENATDIYPAADVEITGAGTDVTFVLEDTSGNEVARVQPNQALELGKALSGTFTVKAEFIGNTKQSPVLWPGAQFMFGAMQSSGDYVSRAFACGSGKKLFIILDTCTPGSSRVDVFVQTSTSGTYTAATQTSSEPLDDNWTKRIFECNCSLDLTRIKITMQGTPDERPYAANLRASILNA